MQKLLPLLSVYLGHRYLAGTQVYLTCRAGSEELFASGRVSDLALIALDKGVSAAVDVLSKDTRIDDKTRECIRTILKGVMRLK